MIPDVKLIALLRNPVDRAISHYFHEQRKGRDDLPIMDAFLAEPERLSILRENPDYKSKAFRNYSYLKRGRYHEQLQRYLQHFQRENLLVQKSEDLFEDPENTMKRVFEFVGVDSQFQVPDLRPHNVGSNRTRIDPEVYEFLKDHFRPHNEALYRLIGQDLGWGSECQMSNINIE